ncbi:hypothetical protein M514_06971 [Trichuris suis]|uniref:Uncharacterized protein n=1 Tax=Trichuris suis TaxID=68888 RepID=A0A085MWN8_9BILA|nr:hypothetical protein M514_06971 [Trichuris suis]
MELLVILTAVIAYLVLVQRLRIRDFGMIIVEMVNVVGTIVSTATSATSRSLDSQQAMPKGKMTPPSDPSSRVDTHESVEVATAHSSYAFHSKGSSGPTQVYPRPGGTESESRVSLRGPSWKENELTGKQRIADASKMSSREQTEKNAQLEKDLHRRGVAGEENPNFGTQLNIGQPVVVTKTASESLTLTPTSLRDNSEPDSELHVLKDYPSSESESEVISFQLNNFGKKDEMRNQSDAPEAEGKNEPAELDVNADLSGDKPMNPDNEQVEQEDAIGSDGEPKFQEAQGSDDQFLDKCVPPEDENGGLSHFSEFRGRQQEEVMANYKYNCIEPQGWPDDERAVLGGNGQDKNETGEDFTRHMLLAYLKDSMTKWLDKVKRIKRNYPGEKVQSKRPKLRKRAASYNYIWNTDQGSDNRGIPMDLIIEQWRNRFAKRLSEEIGDIKSPKREPRGRSRSCGSICMGRAISTNIEESKDAQRKRSKTPPSVQSTSPILRTSSQTSLVKMAEGSQIEKTNLVKTAEGTQKAQQPQATITPKPTVTASVPDLQKPKVPKQPEGTGQAVELKKPVPANVKPEGIKQTRPKTEPARLLQKEIESKERLLAALAEGLLKLHKKALELERAKQEQMQLQMKKMEQKHETSKGASPIKEAEKHQLKDDTAKRLANASQLKPKMKADEHKTPMAKRHRHHSPETSSGGRGIQSKIQKGHVRSSRKQQSPILRAKPTRHHHGKRRRDRSPYHSPIASPRGSRGRHGRHGHHRLNRRIQRKSPTHRTHHHRSSPTRKHAKAKKSRSGRKVDRHHSRDRKSTPERSGKQVSKKHREKRKHDKALLQEHKMRSVKVAGRHLLRREQEQSPQEATIQQTKSKHTIPKVHKEQTSPKWKAITASKEEKKIQARKGSNKSDSDHRSRMPEKLGKVQSPTLTRKDAMKPLKEQAIQQSQTPTSLLRSPLKLSKGKRQVEKKDVSKSAISPKKDSSDALKMPKAKMENMLAERKKISRSPRSSKKDEDSLLDATKAVMERKQTEKKNVNRSPVNSKEDEGIAIDATKAIMEKKQTKKKSTSKSPINSKKNGDGSFKKAGIPKEKNSKEKTSKTKNDLAKRK